MEVLNLHISQPLKGSSNKRSFQEPGAKRKRRRRTAKRRKLLQLLNTIQPGAGHRDEFRSPSKSVPQTSRLLQPSAAQFENAKGLPSRQQEAYQPSVTVECNEPDLAFAAVAPRLSLKDLLKDIVEFERETMPPRGTKRKADSDDGGVPKRTRAKPSVANKPPAQLSTASAEFPVNIPPLGLKNPGQLCYRIGIVQSLMHVPKFFNWLMNHPHRRDDLAFDMCFACRLAAIATKYWRDGRVPGTVTKVFNQLGAATTTRGPTMTNQSWSARENTQQDPSEYLQFLYQAMINDNCVHLQSLNDLIESRLEVTWSCSKCDTLHTSTHETHNILFLPMAEHQRGSNITTYFRNLLTDERAQNCRKCGKQRDGTVNKLFSTFPEMLVVALQRYRITADGSIVRVKDTVRFGPYLDLRNKAAASLPTSGPQGRYLLKAVVAHGGATVDSGHYITSVQSPTGRYTLNNTVLLPITRFQEFWQPKKNFLPYLLFFQRADATPKAPQSSPSGGPATGKGGPATGKGGPATGKGGPRTGGTGRTGGGGGGRGSASRGGSSNVGGGSKTPDRPVRRGPRNTGSSTGPMTPKGTVSGKRLQPIPESVEELKRKMAPRKNR